MQKALQDLSSPQLRRLSLRRRAAIRQHLLRPESGAPRPFLFLFLARRCEMNQVGSWSGLLQASKQATRGKPVW